MPSTRRLRGEIRVPNLYGRFFGIFLATALVDVGDSLAQDHTIVQGYVGVPLLPIGLLTFPLICPARQAPFYFIAFSTDLEPVPEGPLDQTGGT